MHIIVGLGNPGKKYESTRHNMGFKTVDLIAEKVSASAFKSTKFNALISETRIGSEKVLLVKPQTYMNLSGSAVRAILDYYKVSPEEMIVIYDDFDIDAGKIRIRPFGSAGTHNGMRSIVSDIKTDRFPRIRVGIGKKNKGDIIDFVIGGVSSAAKKLLESAIENAADAAISIINDGINLAMNRYNPTKKSDKE